MSQREMRDTSQRSYDAQQRYLDKANETEEKLEKVPKFVFHERIMDAIPELETHEWNRFLAAFEAIKEMRQAQLANEAAHEEAVKAYNRHNDLDFEDDE